MKVYIEICDANGDELRELFGGSPFPTETHTIRVEDKDDNDNVDVDRVSSVVFDCVARATAGTPLTGEQVKAVAEKAVVLVREALKPL